MDKKKSIYGLVGIIKVYGKNIVTFIEEADKVCVLEDAPIYHIKKVGVVLLD